jgi:uncharacterized protein with FMN-binding domain
MLSPGKKRERLAGKLLLTSGLVAASLAYGWWQRHNAAGPRTGAATTMPRAKARVIASAAPTAPSQQNASSAAPLTALATLRMYQPAPSQAPLPLVTGTPAPGATAPIPAGTHLQDGDYLSDMQQYEWGDLQVKIFVHRGQITGAQVVQYPDHRTESLQLSQMASPILDREVIETQQSKVDIVSSATDTSYVFRDAIASAIKKATR